MKLSNRKASGKFTNPKLPNSQIIPQYIFRITARGMKFGRIPLKIKRADEKLQNEPQNVLLAAFNQKLGRRAHTHFRSKGSPPKNLIGS